MPPTWTPSAFPPPDIRTTDYAPRSIYDYTETGRQVRVGWIQDEDTLRVILYHKP